MNINGTKKKNQVVTANRKSNNVKRFVSMLLIIMMAFTSFNLASFRMEANADQTETMIYLIDNTSDKWISNNNAFIELIDNTNGHVHYIMTKVDDITWSVHVPSTAYNITFNRLNPDNNAQWNSWSAGGRDSNNAYYIDGSEYGHWGYMEETYEGNYFHAGDIVYLDLTEFAAWKNDNALMYVNFTGASKEENSGRDIHISNSDKLLYNPKIVDIEVKDNVYACVIGFENEGATELRFWRGNNNVLWNCSVVLSYEDYVKGVNTVKIKNWNNMGELCINECIMDMEADSDGDGLTDYCEAIYGLDKYDADSDNDGLTDAQEIYFTKSNPLKYDSLVEGIADGNADNDEDGLNNKREVELGALPDNADSDGDGLTDGDEVYVYFTDPCNADTDGDTLQDGDEIALCFSPLLVDTDGNGIWDCDEKTFQKLSIEISNPDQHEVSGISVEFAGTGYINSTTSIEDLYGKDIYVSNTEGLVGVPIEINSTSEFGSAVIRFYMDDTWTAEALNNLLIVWYDEDNDRFIEQETIINETDMSVSAKVYHFSKYMIVDKAQWFKAWRNEIDYRDDSEKIYDTVIAIDCSGSMIVNDPNFEYIVNNTLYPGSSYSRTTCYRKLASENFVMAQRSDDQTGIVLFDSTARVACGLTNSRSDLIIAIDKIHSYGGTNFNNAVNTSLNMLLNAREESEKMILLVSDGEETISDSILESVKSNGIKINTVYIGGRYNNELLSNIAAQTGGKYFKAVTADELIDIYSEIMIEQKIDSTDSDGDGIPDIFEISGMKLSNGTVIYTDPFNPDSDNDGLLDGEEIKAVPTYWLNTIFDEYNVPMQIGAYIFRMNSNPNMKNTDGDGLDDFIDNEPCNPMVHEFLIYETSDTDYKAKNCDFIDRPGDFKYADLTESELKDLKWINWSDFFFSSSDSYISNWKFLAWTLSSGKMVDVAMDMIDHFLSGTGEDYTNPILTNKIRNHKNSKEYVSDVNQAVVDLLKEYHGDVTKLSYNDESRDRSLLRKLMYDRGRNNPYFNDKTNGLGICVDGLYGVKIEMTSFAYNENTNHFEYTLKFTYYDIFGLDYSDITDGYGLGAQFGMLAGFRGWYILQHWDHYEGAYQPYFSYMSFEESFQGEL